MNGIGITSTNFKAFRAAAKAAGRATNCEVEISRYGHRLVAEVSSRLLPSMVQPIEKAFWAAFEAFAAAERRGMSYDVCAAAATTAGDAAAKEWGY